jgi:tRNA pseudouridine38-40 synthase
VHWPGQVLASGLRDQAAQLMPAKGLSLEEVGYPPDDQLAARVAQTRAVRTLPG